MFSKMRLVGSLPASRSRPLVVILLAFNKCIRYNIVVNKAEYRLLPMSLVSCLIYAYNVFTFRVLLLCCFAYFLLKEK